MDDPYTREILVSDLEENLADDPYGTAMYVARNVLHRAALLNGSMSEAEHKAVINLEEVLRRFDNA